jgi:predicted transcriptional regulator
MCLLLSIKPEFAERIMSGEKTIELRKRKPRYINTRDRILFYVAAPVKAILFYSYVKQIIETLPNDMWEIYQNRLGITKNDFDIYFKNKTTACGIELGRITKIKPFYLEELKLWSYHSIGINFYAPQDFRYISSDIYYEILLRYRKK